MWCYLLRVLVEQQMVSLLSFFFPQRILVHREAVAAAERIMDRLVNSIRTPPSSPPRKETIKTVSPPSHPLKGCSVQYSVCDQANIYSASEIAKEKQVHCLCIPFPLPSKK